MECISAWWHFDRKTYDGWLLAVFRHKAPRSVSHTHHHHVVTRLRPPPLHPRACCDTPAACTGTAPRHVGTDRAGPVHPYSTAAFAEVGWSNQTGHHTVGDHPGARPGAGVGLPAGKGAACVVAAVCNGTAGLELLCSQLRSCG